MFIDQNQFLSTFFYNRRILITSVFHFVATVEENEEDMTQSSVVLSITTKPMKPVELTKRKWNKTVRSKYDFQLIEESHSSNQNFYYFSANKSGNEHF